MESAFILAITIFGGTVGLLSTLYLVLSLPAVIVWKIFRCFRYKITMYQ